ncbi:MULTISPECIES: hemerythrin domain-containing protein [unclassified Streptomyces]|uniref:hemerythrin domain-containing protein n=1 Tax=unclassified Streptomyces TaxID=2593676 RepID=UPI0036EDFE1F
MSNTRMFDRREMLLIHDVLRREIGLMPRTVRASDPADAERVRIVGGHIAALTGLLHHHHASEDATLWPLLEKRCYDLISTTVALMEEQHQQVDRLVGEVGQALSAWSENPTARTRDALAGTLEELIVALKEHLEAEESQILPAMEEHVTAQEWDDMVREGMAQADPEGMPLGFGMLMYEGDPETVESALNGMPPEFAVVLREKAPAAYAAHAELLYGTSTPPRSTEL